MSTWYRVGTVSVTNGSATVTGSGTQWIVNADVGEGITLPDGRIYEIVGVASNTSLTISPSYLGSTGGGQAYAIAPLRGRIASLLAETSSLLATFATVRDGVGAGLHPDGTVSLPALRFSADQDTGFFRPAANTLGFVTGGTQRVTVTAAGDVGIGTSSPAQRLDVLSSGDTPAVFRSVGANTYFQFVNSVASAGYIGYSGTNLTFWNGPERMRIDSTGNVGIGTTAPNAAAQLQVDAISRGFLPPRMTTAQRDATPTPPDGLMLYNSTTNKLQVRAAGVWVDLH